MGAELDIEFSRARCTLGMYYPKEKKFKFSLLFFNSDVPEACAIDVIRHEYATIITTLFLELIMAMELSSRQPVELCEYSAKVEHPDRFELNSAAAKIEQSNRRN